MAKLIHSIEKRFNKHNYEQNGNTYKLKLNYGKLGRKLDYAQYVLDTQVWQDVQKYMPIDTGNLIAQTNMLNVVSSGKVYLFPPDSDYGHYQYKGIVYVDPKYKVAGWQRPDGTWYSRKDVEKIPSDRKLQYSNPMATAEWGKTAILNHAHEWKRLVKKAMK